MNRNTRTILVLAIAVAIAALASYGVYGAIRSIPVREVEVAHTFVVAASHQMPAGSRVTEADVKLVPWPEKAMLPGSFDKIDQVVAPGTNLNRADAGWDPPQLSRAWQRRRPLARRAAAD